MPSTDTDTRQSLTKKQYPRENVLQALRPFVGDICQERYQMICLTLEIYHHGIKSLALTLISIF